MKSGAASTTSIKLRDVAFTDFDFGLLPTQGTTCKKLFLSHFVEVHLHSNKLSKSAPYKCDKKIEYRGIFALNFTLKDFGGFATQKEQSSLLDKATKSGQDC